MGAARRLRLVHWNEKEATERMKELVTAGFDVEWRKFEGRSLIKELVDERPDALIIDLTRLPMQGRDVGIGIRTRKGTRDIPIVFMIEGVEEGEKMDKVRRSIPDAVFGVWGAAKQAVIQAIAHQPQKPVVPGSNLAGYSGTPLPKKLGIKPGSRVALIDPPPYFAKTVGELPAGARLEVGLRGAPALTIWFPKDASILRRDLRKHMGRLAGAPMWIAWPKKSSGRESDLSETVVRKVGLDAGLVDFKICAIDATWSGLLFTARRTRTGI